MSRIKLGIMKVRADSSSTGMGRKSTSITGMGRTSTSMTRMGRMRSGLGHVDGKKSTQSVTPAGPELWSRGTMLGSEYQMAITSGTSVFEDSAGTKLNYISSALFATILEDTIAAIRILGECNAEMRLTKTEMDMPVLQALRYGIKPPAVLDELAGINSRTLGCDSYKLNKLNEDRKYLIEVLMSTYVDLTMDSKFDKLTQYVKVFHEHENYRPTLLEEEGNHKSQLRELKKELRQQRNYHKAALYDICGDIERHSLSIEDAHQLGLIKSRFVDQWQGARSEQHAEAIHQKERVSADKIEHYKVLGEQEQRVHGELDLVVGILINDALQQIEYWMARYECDMEDIDLRIQIKRSDYDNMVQRRKHIEETMELHEKQMKHWQDYKAERERMRMYQVKMHTSAVIVQAWWRGMLVRLELGPYKPKKQKAPGKKKK